MSNQEIAKYKGRKAGVIDEATEVDFYTQKNNALIKLKEIINDNSTGKFNKAKDKVQYAKEWLTFLEKDVKKKNYKGKGNKNTNNNLQMLLDEYIKVASLEPMEINDNKDYCSINASAGGVTAKVSLVKKEAAEKRLKSIAACQNLKAYKKIQNDTFQLAGIIKLPKNGDILEVQREAIALEIARQLDLDNIQVTESTMVVYNNEPALFVPFGNITLLKDIAKGEQQKQDLGLTGKTYQHYSTLNPVGEGIQPNTIVNDFGNTLAYFYLCSDPDAIGKDNQNKAITKGNNPNQLYLFDQVVMPNTSMKIDSRLKILPTGLRRHSRHFQFRNRSLIEDNDFEAMFQSLAKLQGKRDEINNLMNSIIKGYESEIKKINPHWYSVLNSEDRKQLKQLKSLKKDAQKLQKVLTKRIDALDKVLPKLDVPKGKFDQDNKGHKEEINEIKKGAVILETLLNKPTLYSNEGRPYRTPYTYRNKLSIKSIKIDSNNIATIKFNGKVDKAWLQQIRECHGTSNEMAIDIKGNGRSIKIPIDKLKEIQFKKVFPELSNEAGYESVLDKDVLDIDSLTQLQKCYENDGVNDKGVDIVKKFKTDYDKVVTNQEKITCLKSAREGLVNLKKATTNSGFINHVLRRFDLVAQQRLLSMVDDVSLKNAMKEACEAAVKLDQVNTLNELCQNAIKYGFNSDQNKEGYDEFKGILEIFKKNADSDFEKSCNEGISLKKTYDKIFIDYQKKIEDKKSNPINNNNKNQKVKVSNSDSNNNNVYHSNQPSIDSFKNMSKVNALLNQHLIDGDGSNYDNAIVSNEDLNNNISLLKPLPALIKPVNNEEFNQKNERHSNWTLAISR